MSQDFEFAPFIDYSKISEEMVADLCAATREMESAREEMVNRPSALAVERLLKAQERIVDVSSAIEGSLVTVPVMVHIAGEAQKELYDIDDDESPEVIKQRCIRCKSVLAGWRPGLVMMSDSGPVEMTPEMMTWHTPGEQIAKSAPAPGLGLTIYTIPDDQELEKHERECVGFPNFESEETE